MWAYSFNGTDYTGSYETKEAAIEEAREDFETNKELPFPDKISGLWVGVEYEPEIHWSDFAEYYIDSMQDHLDDECGGEWSENFANDQVTRADEELLDERLNAVVEEWIKDCDIKPGFFLIANDSIEEVDISDWQEDAGNE